MNKTTTKRSPGSVLVQQLEERHGDTAVVNGNYVASKEASKQATNAVALGTYIFKCPKTLRNTTT